MRIMLIQRGMMLLSVNLHTDPARARTVELVQHYRLVLSQHHFAIDQRNDFGAAQQHGCEVRMRIFGLIRRAITQRDIVMQITVTRWNEARQKSFDILYQTCFVLVNGNRRGGVLRGDGDKAAAYAGAGNRFFQIRHQVVQRNTLTGLKLDR